VRVRGRSALVTGGSAGAGRGIARRLAAEGADVVVGDLGDRDVAAIGARYAHLDVTDDEELAAVIAEVAPAILVNNAGGGGHIPPFFPDGDWSLKLDLNLRAPMRATQLAVATGAEAVVNIASSAGLQADAHRSAEYAAAKAGLIRFTTSVRLDGVRVNCVVPDWILTERAAAELERMSEAERAQAPVPIPVEAIADAVLTLIADDALSGRVLVLDGGVPPRLL
jgi:NAD(P)-dependent dehydrogenase (short-subunit alcohol dehydrogenase family)